MRILEGFYLDFCGLGVIGNLGFKVLGLEFLKPEP